MYSTRERRYDHRPFSIIKKISLQEKKKKKKRLFLQIFLLSFRRHISYIRAFSIELIEVATSACTTYKGLPTPFFRFQFTICDFE